MSKRLQYDVVVSGISNAQAKERVSPDKWLGNHTVPQASWAKAAAYSLAVIAPSLFFANTAGQPKLPERTTPEKYVSQPAMPAPRATFGPHLLAATVEPVAPVVAPSTVTVDRWYAQETRQPRPAPAAAYLAPCAVGPIAPPETVTVDKWFVAPQQPVQAPQRSQPQLLQTGVLPVEQPAVPLDRWHGESARPRFDSPRAHYLAPTHVEPIITSSPEVVTVDKWFAETVRPRFDAARTRHLLPTEVAPISPVFGERTTPDKWWPCAPDLLSRAVPTTYLAATGAPAHNLTTAPPVHVDAWYVETQRPPLAASRPLPVPATSVAPILPLPAAITPDRWATETQRPVWDVARRQGLAPASSVEPILPLPNAPQVITVDMWFAETQRPVCQPPRYLVALQTGASPIHWQLAPPVLSGRPTAVLGAIVAPTVTQGPINAPTATAGAIILPEATLDPY